MRFFKFTYIILFFVFAEIKAQDAQFSQYYAAPLHLSPSFAGAHGGGRIVLNHRIQWPIMSVPYNTFSMSVDYNLINFNSGVGFVIVNELAGTPDLYRTKAGLQYAYNVGINKQWNLRPAIELSYSFMGFMNDKDLVFGDQIFFNRPTTETSEEDVVQSINYPDAGASLLAFSSKYWGGLTVAHLMRPNVSIFRNEDKLPMKYLLYGGGKVDLNGRLGRNNEESLFYSFLYRSQGKADQLDIGAYWYKLPLIVGFWYRGLPVLKKSPDNALNHDAITLIVGYRLQEIGFAYSYDATISRLVINTGGTHEISAVFLFNQEQRRKKRAKRVIVPCPRF